MYSLRLAYLMVALSAVVASFRISSCFQLERFSHEMASSKIECYQCHVAPKVGYHLSFGHNCSKCHRSNVWVPAQYHHPRFPIVEDHYATCIKCHPDTLYAYTCYGCHEKERMIIKHEKFKLNETILRDCVICHPNGKVPEFNEEGE